MVAVTEMAANKSLDKFNQGIDRLVQRQIPYAMARTLTTLAQNTKKATEQQMRQKLVKPTPWTMSALFLKPATKDDLSAVVNVKDGGYKRDGVKFGATTVRMGSQDKRAVIQQQFQGGSRLPKPFETRLQRIDVLPSGMSVVIPAKPSWAMPLDQYGNAPRGLVVKLLAYFMAFIEAGASSNMTNAGRARLAKRGQRKGNDYAITTASGKKKSRGYMQIGGVVYFVSYGRGSRRGKFAHNQMDQHLPAGIWAKRGIHGSDVSPVFLFVRQPKYQAKIDMPSIAHAEHAANFKRLFAHNLADAVRTAR